MTLSTSHSIDLKPEYQEMVLRILQTDLPSEGTRVWLFGSRATGTAIPTSDIDLALEHDGDAPTLMSQLRESFEESRLPYLVDLVDLRLASQSMKERIDQEGVQIWPL